MKSSITITLITLADILFKINFFISLTYKISEFKKKKKKIIYLGILSFILAAIHHKQADELPT